MNVVLKENFVDIKEALSKIEQDSDINILYAVEVGDYIRGIVDKKSKHIVLATYTWNDPKKNFDIINSTRNFIIPQGKLGTIYCFSLKKMLTFAYASHPKFLNLITSNIIYQRDEKFAKALLDLGLNFSPKKLTKHYLHDIKTKQKFILKERESFTVGEYIEILSPILSIENIYHCPNLPAPLYFKELLQGAGLGEQFITTLNTLSTIKMNNRHTLYRDPGVNSYISSAPLWAQSKISQLKDRPANLKDINAIYFKWR